MCIQLDNVAATIFGIDIYWYGVIITIGIMLAVFTAVRLSKLRGYGSDMLLDFAFIAILLGIIGARLYYVAFSWDEFSGQLDKIFTWRMTGLAIYGGVIGGAIGGVIFSKWKKVSFWDLADACMPAVILAQAIGRWGNFFNQEVYGAALQSVSLKVNNHLALAPPAVFIDATGEWHVALFLIESVWNLFSFAMLLLIWKKKPHLRGAAFSVYLILYCGARFILEGFRIEQYTLYFLGMRVSQVFSLITAAAGVVMLYFCIKRGGFKEMEIPEKYLLKDKDKKDPVKDEE